MDPHLVALDFNEPNDGAGLFCKYQTSAVETQNVQ
jgi:hypothetical protein